MSSKKALLRPLSQLPGLLIGFVSSVERTAAVADYLPAHRRRGPLQTSRDLPDRRTGGNASGDVFPFGQRECSLRAVTDCRSDPAVLRQQELNRAMVLAEGTTNLMQ